MNLASICWLLASLSWWFPQSAPEGPFYSAFKDGTTHIVMSPLEFMQRLAALVPRPRLHLIRFHRVFGVEPVRRRNVNEIDATARA